MQQSNPSTLTPTTTSKSVHAWLRFKTVWVLVGILFLVASAILVAVQGQQPPWTWAVFSLFVLWFAGLSGWELRFQRKWVAGTTIYLTLGIAIWGCLGYYNPTFFILMGLLFPAVFRLLPATIASILAALLSLVWATLLWQFHGMIWWKAYSVAISFHLAGWSLGLFIHSIIVQSISRQELVETLELTQSELGEAERRAGMLEERRRLANELHDTIAQCFTSIIIHLEAAEATAGHKSAPLNQHLQAAKMAAREGLAQTRDRVWSLRPDQDQKRPLDAVLRQFGESWSAEKHIELAFQVTGKSRNLPEAQANLLLRCARESLQNIFKHAQGDQVVMTLSYMDGEVALDVIDNGQGFVTTAQPDGYGLAAMRHAVEAIQGQMVVESSLGEGVSLAVSLPTPLADVETEA